MLYDWVCECVVVLCDGLAPHPGHSGYTLPCDPTQNNQYIQEKGSMVTHVHINYVYDIKVKTGCKDTPST